MLLEGSLENPIHFIREWGKLMKHQIERAALNLSYEWVYEAL
ncbi:hypothetical protein BSG1_16115 [Bacillus sp. SG-1]|nr:hypothetical protein BSG1_16115 [Bacillus sp. SG-1]